MVGGFFREFFIGDIMSSDNKKIFVTSASSKGQGDTITSNPIIMPDHSEGHVLSVKTDASCTGVVDVELEMSPDGQNWCPAVTRTVGATSGANVVDVIGNEEYVKLTPDAGEFKNKHARGGLNFDVNGAVVTPDGSGARDLLDQHIAVNKSFNYSQWFKTSEAPTTTYKPVLFRHGGHDDFENTKTIELTDAGAVVGAQNNYYVLRTSTSNTSDIYVNKSASIGIYGAQGTQNNITGGRDFTTTFWVYLDSTYTSQLATSVGVVAQGTNAGVYFNLGIEVASGTFKAKTIYNTGALTGLSSTLLNMSDPNNISFANGWYLYSVSNDSANNTLHYRIINQSGQLFREASVTYTSFYDFDSAYSGGALQSNAPQYVGIGQQIRVNGVVPDFIQDEWASYDTYLSTSDLQKLTNGTTAIHPLNAGLSPTSFFRFGDVSGDSIVTNGNIASLSCEIGSTSQMKSYRTTAMYSYQYDPVTYSHHAFMNYTPTGAKITQNLCEPVALPFSSVFTSTADFSISGWFKTTDVGTLFSNTGGTASTGLKVDVSSSNITASYLGTSNTTSVSGTFNDGNWHHIIMVMSPGSQLIIVDNLTAGTSSHTLTNSELQGSNGFTLLSDGQNNANAASPASTDPSKLHATLSNWSIHSEALDEYGIAQLYSNGHVRNAMNLPSVDSTKVEGFWQLNDQTTPEQDLSGNSNTLQYQDGGSNTLVSQQVNADGATLVEKSINGNALTLSLTKSFNFTTKSWVSTADQDTALCLSFNGFEEQAEHIALWKCAQTVGGTTIDICDGEWHNVVLSYRGNNDLAGNNVAEGDPVKFGPGPAQNLPHNFMMSFDGEPLKAINDGSGADHIDGLGSTITDTYNSVVYNVGFNIYNRHLKYQSSNTQEVYKPHAQFSAGIHEAAGVDNINAFQGSVDETSFHSDCWWVDQAGTSILTNTFNQEKPATLYGSTTALTNRGAGSDYPTGVPYPLLNPEKIGSAVGGNQWINPARYDASTNPNGGLEGWWRWGDTPGDCSITINDVRDHDDSINARDLSAFEIVTSDRQDMSVTPESIYLATTETTGAAGISITFPQVIVGAIQAGICNLKQMESPILKYLRVKFTGAGSCDLGSSSTEAQINFKIKE